MQTQEVTGNPGGRQFIKSQCRLFCGTELLPHSDILSLALSSRRLLTEKRFLKQHLSVQSEKQPRKERMQREGSEWMGQCQFCPPKVPLGDSVWIRPSHGLTWGGGPRRWEGPIMKNLRQLHMHVGTHTYSCVKSGYFFLLINLISIWLLNQSKETWGSRKVSSSPTLEKLPILELSQGK